MFAINDKPPAERAMGYLGLLLSAAAGYWLLARLGDVLIPPIVGLLLAYLVDPLVRRYERWLKNRSLAVFAVLVTMVAAITAVVLIMGPMVQNEIDAFRAVVLSIAQPDSPLHQQLIAKIPAGFVQKFSKSWWDPSFVAFFKENADVHDLAVAGLKRIVPGLARVLSGAMSLVAVVFSIFLSLVYFILFAADLGTWRTTWPKMLPTSTRAHVIQVVKDFDHEMSLYFRGQALVAVIMGIILAVGFVMIDLRMAILFGMFAGLLSMVPYLQLASVPFAGLLAVVTAVEDGRSVGVVMLSVLAVYAVAQALQDWVLIPRVMEKLTGLSPALILLSLFVWGRLLGPVGFFLAIPLSCLALAYYKRWLARTNDV
jgi:predicted PurR-regulated permease PerM